MSTTIDRMARLEELLEKTSRTFALSIPVLPDPTRAEVTIAYLLFRIADTLEDATAWGAEEKGRELAAFQEQLRRPDAQATATMVERWVARPPLDHAGYNELLAETPLVMQALADQSEAAREAIVRYTCETAERMAGFARRSDADGELQLDDVDDLKDYCYAVAGLVGEMLTELFVLDRAQLAAIAPRLQQDAATFGEALQLVNILKDAADDATEGRRFLPAEVDLATIFALARRDLDIASDYVGRLQQAEAPRGLVEFTALPVLLAWATLDVVESAGAGAKITRDQVGEIVEGLMLRLEAGEPAIDRG